MSLSQLKYALIMVFAGATVTVGWHDAVSEPLPTVQPGFPRSLLPPPIDPNSSNAPAPALKPKVYALVLGHGADETIGEGVQVSGRRLETVLHRAFPGDDELVLKFVGFLKNDRGPDNADGQPLTIANINAAIAEVNTKVREKVDTVVCFMLAHGAFGRSPGPTDPPDEEYNSPKYEYGHYFGMEQSPSYLRSTLTGLLVKAKPKLMVLLSDSCNVRSDLAPIGDSTPAAAPAAVTRLDSLRTLLLKHTGVVSINASSPGQFSFYNASQGGYFMQAVDEVLHYCRPDVNWHEFFALVTAETANVFHTSFPKGCPYAWDAKNRQVLTLPVNDLRTQKVLQPFTTRRLTEVIQDDVHVQGGASPMCPCPSVAAIPEPVPAASLSSVSP